MGCSPRPLSVLVVWALAGCALSTGQPPDTVPSPAGAAPATASQPTTPEGAEVVYSEHFAVRPHPPALSPRPPSPTATNPPPTPLPEPQPFAMNLYTDGDFVPQHTFEWCVAASIQMAYNMARDPNRSSAEDQQMIWNEAKARSNDQWGGASGRGWAALLIEWGIGEYVLATALDYDTALTKAARAMRNNGLPVGLIMWRGRHAWVMSGFESIGDPAIHADFVVTGIRVLDPLYPYGDAAWGPSPAPNTLLTPDELAHQFKPREWGSGPDSPPGYVLVLPVEPQS